MLPRREAVVAVTGVSAISLERLLEFGYKPHLRLLLFRAAPFAKAFGLPWIDSYVHPFGSSAMSISTRAASSNLPDTLPGGVPWPLVSVVTPSLNQGRYLEENIRSVLDQGYPRVEHLIIDGGSTDGTGNILARYKKRLAYAVSEKDRGQSHAINKGFARASGEILTWLNADDQLAPGALASMALAFSQSQADLVAGVCRLLKDDTIIGEHLTGCLDGRLALDELLDLDGHWTRGRFFHQPEVMFTREIWEAAGGYVDESLYYSMDYEMWVRFADAGARLHVIGAPIAVFRVHEDQKTSHPDKYLPELRRVCAELHKRLNVQPKRAAADPHPKRASTRVTMLNDVGFDFGAGIAHERIGQALRMHGHEVHSLCLTGEGLTLSTAENGEILAAIGESEPDVVILGNLHGARIEPELIGQISERWPVYQVLHDFWPLTGRCAYTGDCEKYLTGCDALCPTAHEYPVLDSARIHAAWLEKQQILDSPTAPVLLANSTYTEQKAKRMLGMQSRADVQRVELAVPTEIFSPGDPVKCRAELGLPADAFVVLFSACSLDEPRKGLKHLLDALKRVQIPNLHLACVGSAADLTEQLPDITAFGYIRKAEKLASIYSAADVFVGPSLEETFGQVFIEAAACGTPAIAFRVAGAVDAIVEGVTGVFADALCPDALAARIQQMYDDVQLRDRLGQLGPLYIRNERTYTTMYRSLYHAFEQTKRRFNLQLPMSIRPAVAGTDTPPLTRLTGNKVIVEFGPRFSQWEAPESEQELPRLRRTTSPRSTLLVTVGRPGRYTLRLVCLRRKHRQEVVITCNQRYVTRRRLELAEKQGGTETMYVDLPLAAGGYEIGLHLLSWTEGPHKAQHDALMVTEVSLRRRFALFGKKSFTSNTFKRLLGRPKAA